MNGKADLQCLRVSVDKQNQVHKEGRLSSGVSFQETTELFLSDFLTTKTFSSPIKIFEHFLNGRIVLIERNTFFFAL